MIVDVSALIAEGTLVDPKILLIESEVGTVRTVMGGLEQAGMQVVWARDGASGLALRARLQPEILLVGLRLPDMNSVSLVGQLVEPRNSGVIVLASSEDEAARVACLELGADDYLSKPSSLRDMVARIRSVHRRVNVRNSSKLAQNYAEAPLAVGPIRINLQHRSVHTPDGRRLNLTSAEYTALETLARADGSPVSRDRLSEAALRRPWRPEDRSVDQLVFNLRQKLPVDVDGSVLIQSIRGSGYWMRAPERPAPRRSEFGWAGDEAATRPSPELQMVSSA